MKKNTGYKYKLKGAGYQILRSPDKKLFASVGGSVRLFDCESGKQIGENIRALQYPSEIAFSSDSRYLAIKNTSGHIAVFDILENKVVCKNYMTRKEGAELYFTPDDKYIVTADWNGNILLLNWRENKYEIIKTITQNNKKVRITSIQHVFPNIFVFMADIGDILKITWNYPFCEEIYKVENKEGILEISCPNKRFDLIIREKRSKDYDYYKSYYYLTIIKDDEVIRELHPENKGESYHDWHYISYSSWHPQGNYLATISSFRTNIYQNGMLNRILVFNTETWEIVKVYTAPPVNIRFVGFDDFGEYLMIGTETKGFCIDVNNIELGEKEVVLK